MKRESEKSDSRFLCFMRDGLLVEAAFTLEAVDDPDGTTLARMTAPWSDDNRFLGVAPNESNGNAFQGKPTSYADKPYEPNSGNLSALHRIFSRGRVKEVCDETGADATDLLQLRDRCVEGAKLAGGEVAACTACTEIASLHIPMWLRGSAYHGTSRCELLGGKSLRGKSGVSWWYDMDVRLSGDGPLWDAAAPSGELWDEAYGPDYAPEVPARVWCTGTAYPGEEGSWWRNFASSTVFDRIVERTELCGPSDVPVTLELGRVSYRTSEIDSEAPSLFPDILNVEMTSSYDRNPATSSCSTSAFLYFQTHESGNSYDELMLHDAEFLPLWADEDLGIRSHIPEIEPGRLSPLCGVESREMSWNASCDQVLSVLGSDSRYNRGIFGEPTSSFAYDPYGTGDACTILESPYFATCAPGWDFACDAAGRCQSAPRLVRDQ